MPDQTSLNDVAPTVVNALRDLVSKPDLYLVRAAQASTLKQLKSARTLLRDFNAAAKHQLEQQVAASEATILHLSSIRQDLDHVYTCLRKLKQQLAEQDPELYQQLLRELAKDETE